MSSAACGPAPARCRGWPPTRRCCTPRRAQRFSGASFDHADYWASAALGAGAPVACDVYARQPWNVTGLFLEAGTPYRFTASGQWLDGSVPCGPGGAEDGTFHFGEILQLAGTVIDQTEDLWRKLSDDERAEFWGSRRVNGYPWFSLVGVVANAEDGVHETFPIGAGTTYTPKRSGYLYAYANDAWAAYGNNRGSVRMTVEVAPGAPLPATGELAAADP